MKTPTHITILIVLLFGSSAIVTHSAQASLTLDVATTVDEVRTGDRARVEFTVGNTDGAARNNVVLTMPYPNGLNPVSESNFDGDCPSSTCTAGELVTWDLGSIPSGGSVTVHIAPNITSTTADGTVIEFDASVTDSSLDDASVATTITARTMTNFDITLSETHDPATPGSLQTYRVDFGFLADVASVTNSTLALSLPGNVTFVSASDGGTLSGSTVEWPLGFLSPGDSGVRDVHVMIDPSAQSGDVVSASATISQVGDATNALTSSVSTSVATMSGLQLAIENNRDQVRGSGPLSYVLTVTNNDPFTRFGVNVRGAYPNSLNPLSEAYFEGDCGSSTCTSGERMTFTVGDIVAGGSKRFEMPVVATSTSTGGELINLDLTVTDLAGLQTRQTEVIRVNSDTLYEVIITDSAEPALTDAELSYRIDFAYRADAATVNNTELVVTLPDQVTFDAASDGGVHVGNTVTWNLGFMSPGEGGTRTIDVTTDTGLTNATVLPASARLQSLTTPAEFALSQINTIVGASTGLQVAMESNVTPVRPSSRNHYQLVVSNTDPFTRFGVELTLIYPNEFNPVSEANFEGDCGSSTCTAGEIVVWQLGDLAANSATTVDLPSVLNSGALSGRLIPLLMLVEDDQGLQSSKGETLRVSSDSPFEMVLSADRDPVTVGDVLTYTIKYAYREDVASVVQNTMDLELPDGTTFVSASNGATHANGVVSWNLGFMTPNDGGRLTATVMVDTPAPANQVLEAVARMSLVGDLATRSRAELHTIVADAKGLQISTTANPDSVRSGDLSNYRISVLNNDPFTRFNVNVSSIYGDGLNPLSEANFNGDCGSSTCTAGERVTWLVGDIGAGEARTVYLPSFVTAGQVGGEMTTINTLAEDDLGAHARSTTALRIQNDTVYDVAIDASADPVAPGSSLTYRVTYGYREDAGQVLASQLRLPLAPGTSFVSATAGGQLIGGVVEWDLGNLAPGEGGIVEVVVTVDSALVDGQALQTAATLIDANSQFESAVAETMSVVATGHPLSVTAQALTVSAEPGRELAILYTVTNNDAFSRFGVTLSTMMPPDLNVLFDNNADFAGDCPGTSCTSGERIQWALGELPAGATVSVLLPPIVANGAVDGSVMSFNAWVTDQLSQQARAGVALYTGCLDAIDGDCDGIVDTSDNCRLSPNTPQRDTDGDGFGNACDPDLNNDQIVNFIDISLFSARFLTSDADADLNGDGAVNFLDYVIMTEFFLSPPGPGAL
ncbi:MAG: dockerin type I domain-containing protein [Pseudomonadota bacterium]